MKNHTYLQEDEMIRRAIHALIDQLGPIETARFLALPRQRRMDSIRRHRQWQANLDKDRFYAQVFDLEIAS
jgi:hypothetical protein